MAERQVNVAINQTRLPRLEAGATNKFVKGDGSLGLISDIAPSPPPPSVVTVDDSVNMKKFLGSGQTDITAAVNSALAEIKARPSKSGRIYIPRADTFWTTDGGHIFDHGIDIAGDGWYIFGSDKRGSKIKLNAGKADNIFTMTGDTQNVKLSGIYMDLNNRPNDGIGFKVTGIAGNYHLNTRVINCGFESGLNGIRIESSPLQVDNFVCEDSLFYFCRAALYNDSPNGSIRFTNPYIYLAKIDVDAGRGTNFTEAGVAFDIRLAGTLVVEYYNIVGNGAWSAQGAQTDNSRVLQTYGAFNKIIFRCGQDERVQYLVRTGPFAYANHAVVFENSLIQSQYYATKDAAVVFDSCRLVNDVNTSSIKDSADGSVTAMLKGFTTVITRTAANSSGAGGVSVEELNPPQRPRLTDAMTNPYSKIIDAKGNINSPVITPAGTLGRQPIHASVGTINIASGQSSIIVDNNLVNANSLVNAWLTTFDPSAVIKAIEPGLNYFNIILSAAVTANRTIAFKVEA